MNESRFNLGDRAMLVRATPGGRGEIHITHVTVAKVYANGHVILEGGGGRFRPDGSATGKHSAWSSPSRIQPWDDAAWQDFQRRQARDAAKGKLFQLSDRLAKIARNNAEEAAEIWCALPFSVRCLIEDDNK
jgi:hypothetical protein